MATPEAARDEVSDLAPPRYERKFFLSHLPRQEIELLVRLHPAVFSEIFQPRAINNVYFDSPDLRFYHQTVDGVAERRKYRIRWYGELSTRIKAPVLEVKLRHGLMIRKRCWPIEPFTVDALDDAEQGPAEIREELRCLRPTLFNRYHRKYFRTADGSVRLTLDWNLAVARPEALSELGYGLTIDRSSVILELKYAVGKNHEAAEIASWFPFRLTRSSKYVRGIDLLDGRRSA